MLPAIRRMTATWPRVLCRPTPAASQAAAVLSSAFACGSTLSMVAALAWITGGFFLRSSTAAAIFSIAVSLSVTGAIAAANGRRDGVLHLFSVHLVHPFAAAAANEVVW